ncbi:hypothetical protein GCM10010275_51020 [Streptomyces litmocidini]|nr:hypothetical protein GCM10010275_51020 [Streptomyces litmocidini]
MSQARRGAPRVTGAAIEDIASRVSHSSDGVETSTARTRGDHRNRGGPVVATPFSRSGSVAAVRGAVGRFVRVEGVEPGGDGVGVVGVVGVVGMVGVVGVRFSPAFGHPADFH